MSKLMFLAGQEAYDRIKQQGLTPQDIKCLVAAAGGPKWFTTYGLMRAIISDFLHDCSHPMHFLGSSVGAWQVTAALTSDPRAALDRLQQKYCNATYSEKPNETEISYACAEMIHHMLGDESSGIINHPNRNLHIITSRGKGWLSSNQKVLKGLGFAYTFSANAISRKYVGSATERVIFTSGNDFPYAIEKDVLPTTKIPLTSENLFPALQASGSIPFVMEGVPDIPDAPNGTYWDGGLTDYHIALPYQESIILHPHFFPFVLPGWLDKKIPWNRGANPDLMSKVLLVCPSESYVNSLPLKRISDMKDLYHFGLDQRGRIDYWQEISIRSKELGEEFMEMVTSGAIRRHVKRYRR